jgi:hypothetical protein
MPGTESNTQTAEWEPGLSDAESTQIHFKNARVRKLTHGYSRGLSAWTPALAESSAGGSYSPFAFTVPLFKRTPTGAPPSPPVWLRRRYRNPMFFAAL